MSSAVATSFRLSMCQILSGADKAANIATAEHAIASAAAERADVVVLPECWNSPYGTSYFPKYAEAIPGETSAAMSSAARRHGVWLVAGSIPERDEADGKLYNTCMVFNRAGELAALHRKVHLFDIDMPGMRFRESETLAAGSALTRFRTEYGWIGVGICYDVRFAEMASIAADAGCVAMLYPGAFNMKTGPLHWELLLRARAVDNQFFVAGVSPARDTSASYVSYAHSMLVSPWGRVVASAGAEPALVTADVDLSEVDSMRAMIPIRSQKRPDVYASARPHAASDETGP